MKTLNAILLTVTFLTTAIVASGRSLDFPLLLGIYCAGGVVGMFVSGYERSLWALG